jgi:glycosyltransferase involved in cell wall biosynthesis
MNTENPILLSIVIPAYNEEDRIVTTLKEAFQYLAQQSYTSEIWVVSDGSIDKTTDVVKTLTPPENVEIFTAEYKPNRGKGYAVRYGMLKARGAYVLFMDADYAVPLEYVDYAFKEIEKGADVAIGTRRHPEAKVENTQNFLRQISSKAFNLIQAAYLGLDFKDTQCGFKMFRHDALEPIFSKQKLNSIVFDPEILWLAKKQHFKIVEFPVAWEHNEDSRIQYNSLRKSLFIFQELFKIRTLHKDL